MNPEILQDIRANFFGHKMSQAEFAEKIGIDKRTVSAYERGTRAIPKYLAARLIKLGVPADRLQVSSSGAPLSDIERQLIQAQAEARVWRESYYELLKRIGSVDKK